MVQCQETSHREMGAHRMPHEDAVADVKDARDAAAEKRYAGPEYRRLLDVSRRSLERTGGDLTRTVTVKTPDDRERRAIIGITGQYRPEGVSVLAVRLADFDQAIREATGHSLAWLLERLGPALKDRPAERQRLSAGREAAIRSAEVSFLSGRSWYQAWLAELAADGTVTRLVNAGETDQVRLAARVLEWVERRTELKAAPTQLAELAATITGDTKALNHGSGLGTLVLRALAFRLGAERPKTTEERRDLWDRSSVIVDDLASRVLVLNLPAAGDGLGEWLTSAKEHGTPFYVTLHQLVTLPITVPLRVRVRICENPAVLRRAAGELGARAQPLICTEGQPSTAFHRLVAAITKAGGELSYHGDFDWPGITIATGVMTRHRARPWRFGATDYDDAVGKEGVPLAGTRQPTPWDPALADLMTAHGRAVYEESVADGLIADLARPGEPAWDLRFPWIPQPEKWLAARCGVRGIVDRMISGPGFAIRYREDEVTRQQVRPGTARRVWPYLRRYRGQVVLLLGMTAVESAVVVVTTLILRLLIDDGILPHRASVVVALALTVAGLGLLDAGVDYVRSWYSAWIAENLILELRVSVFRHILRQPLAFFTRTQTGALVSRLDGDISETQQAVGVLMSESVFVLLNLAVVAAQPGRAGGDPAVPAARQGSREAGAATAPAGDAAPG
jgi:uncharacterized protein (TIGR02679 family)